MILVIDIVAILDLAGRVFGINGDVYTVVPSPFATATMTAIATFASAITASTSVTTVLIQRCNLDGVFDIHLLDEIGV